MVAPIGVITLQRRAVRPFTEKQIELFETFADQAGDRHRNRTFVRRGASAHQGAVRIAGTADGNLRGSRGDLEFTRELEPLFNKMLENATRVCNAKFDRYCFRSGMYFGPSHSTTCRPRRRRDPTIQRSPDSPVSRVGRTKQIVYITLPWSAQCDDATHLPLLDAQIPPAGAETTSLVKGGTISPVDACVHVYPFDA
jgi:hypothetical protein